MKFELPLPPSSNRIWRVAHRRIILSAEAQAYKAEVGLLLNTMQLTPLDGPVRVWLFCYMPKNQGDLCNREKLLLDCLQGHAYHNDKQIVSFHMRRRYEKGVRMVKVMVEPEVED